MKLIFLFMTLTLASNQSNAQNDNKEPIEALYKQFVKKNNYGDSFLCIEKNNPNYNKLKELVISFNNQNYFPGYSELGTETVEHYTDMLLKLQDETVVDYAIKLMYNQVLAKNANPTKYANYIDKQTYSKSKYQLYGTIVNMENITSETEKIRFVFIPISDSANVETRRALIGLPTLNTMIENYKKQFLRLKVS